MKIENLKNKVKILLEYPKKLLNYGTISGENRKKLCFKVFLNDGSVVANDEIKAITFAVSYANSGENDE